MPKKLAAVTTDDDDQDDHTEAEPEAAAPAEETPDPALAEILFRGTTFTIPKDMDEWLTEACLALGQSDYMLASKILLGPQQWAILQTLGDKRKDIREFLTVFARVINEECVG